VWFTDNNALHTVEIWPGAQGNARIHSTQPIGPRIIQLDVLVEVEPASTLRMTLRFLFMSGTE
jgi:hypothetical protein